LVCQSFNEIKTIEVEPIYGDVFYNYYYRIQSENKTIIPLVPLYENDFDSIALLIIDSLDNLRLLHWKCEKDMYGDNDIATEGVFLTNDEILLMSQYYLYYLRIKGNQLFTKRRISLPQGKDGDFDAIYPIGENSSTHVLLVNTYNFSRKGATHDIFRIAKFNIKKKKIEKKITIDVGKGIFLSHFNYQMVSTSKNNIAIANPCKPEIYLFDNDLNPIDTIIINYQNIYKTKNLLDSILTDKIILENKNNTANLIKILHDNKIIRYPKINKIAFIDEDLLFVLVQPDVNVNDNNWAKNKLHYIYSLSNKDFFDKEGMLSDFKAINSSQPLIFHNKRTVTISDTADTNDFFKYYISFWKLAIDFNSKYIDTINPSLLPSSSNLESLDSFNINYLDFNYVMIADYSACSHCKFGNKFQNILIIHTFSQSDKIEKSEKLVYRKKYHQMFDSPKVYFCADSMINTKLIKINTIYRINKQ
jgi:hypothetical protein